MPVSLGWLLKRDELQLRSVAGPVDGVQIEWAHAIELEDPAPWLTGGELVLTTGLRLPRSAIEQRAYVERLAGRGVAALAFGTGVRYKEIPTAVVDACASLDLPLVEVPLPTPFIAITQTVAAALNERRLRTLRRTIDHQKRATRSAVRRGPVGVVAELGRELKADVVLVDEHGGVIAATSSDEGLLDVVREQRDRLANRRAGSTVLQSPAGEIELQKLPGRAGSRGWLGVRAQRQLDSTERLLVNQAAALLTILLDRPRELAHAYRELGATVLDLALGEGSVGEQVVEQLHRFGFEPDDRVVVVRVDPGSTAGALTNEVAEALDGTALPHLVTNRSPGDVVLLRATDARVITAAILDRLARAEGHGVVLGVSSEVPQQNLADALAAAEQAAMAARRQRAKVAWFDQLTLHAVLADKVVRDRVATFAAPTLAPLLSSTSARDRELVASLDSFLHHNGAWEPAARALGLHRHTLRNHIARVEELTGLSLEVAEHRVLLMLALMTRAN